MAEQIIKSIMSQPISYKIFWVLLVLALIGTVLSSTATGILLLLCSVIAMICVGIFIAITER